MFENESLENKQINQPANEPEARGEPASTAGQEPARDSGYEYVFSSGTGTPSHPPKAPRPKNRHLGLLITGICFAVVFCLMFVAAIVVVGIQLSQGTNTTIIPNGNTDTTTTRPNATVVLETADRTNSEFGSAGEDVFSESQVVRMVHDAVVVIDTKTAAYDFFGRAIESSSSGSGVVISADGYILTCNHVVSGATSIQVSFNDGTKYSAVLVGADSTSDLAVLQIDAENLPHVTLGNSADLVPGEHVIAIGNPLGTLGGTVTSGIISATERNIVTEDGTTMTLIQTDAAINSGNSGGGLFNLDGHLIGIVNAKYASSGVEGLAFAIPVDSAKTIVTDLIQYGYVRGVIDDGLSALDITSSNLSSYRYYGITKTGLYVVDSKYCEDLKNKDRIVSINGTEVNTVDEWNNYLKENCKVGDTITIVYERDGREASTQLTLREYRPTLK